ncbi:hypothetical protein TNCV_604971 [Trichonephila clavipes]|nr:hypothetical protein TNCV_604971 [Trichonephila clavipes]
MPRLAYFAHANVFHQRGATVPIRLATIPENGSEPYVYIITVDHSQLPMPSKDWSTIRWIHDHIHLPLQIPDSLPLKYVPFLFLGKYSSLDNGEGDLVVVKGSDQKKDV